MAVLATATKNARGNALTAEAGTGAKLQIYTASYATKLAEWTWTGNVWPTMSTGSMAMNAPTAATVTGLATGTAAIARLTKTDGTTAVAQDFTVGTSGAEVGVSNTSIASGQNCTLNTFTVTEA